MKDSIKKIIEKGIIENLLCNALEGGSNYWYQIKWHNKNEIKDCKFLSDLLNHENGKMIISHDDQPEGKIVTHNDLLNGWELFKNEPKYIKHYSNAINEHDDATIADIFFQLVVIGDVIYS